MSETPSWRVVCLSAGSPAFSVIRTAAWYALFAALRAAVRVSAPGHHAERRAGKGTPTSGRHSPPQAGGREGPRVGLWFASRQGPASSAQVSRSRACRAEVGVPLPAASTAGLEAPTGRNAHDRAGPAHPAGMKVHFTGWCQSRPQATMQSDAEARERRPLVGTARRRRAAEKDPELACGLPLGRARRHRRRFRAPARADRRSAFPCGRRHPDGWGSRADLHFHSNWPLSRAVCVSGYARVSLASGQRCRSRPHATMQSDAQARERRPLVGTARRRRAAGKDPELAGGSPLGRARRHRRRFRAPARAGPHRENCPEVGVPLPAASTAGLEAPTGSTGGVPLLRAFCGGGTLPSAKKGLAANFVRCRRFRGKV